MGSKGSKPRKPSHSQHLPKVGTRDEIEYEQHLEREAVLDVMGISGFPSWAKWSIIAFCVLLLIGAVLGLMFVVLF